MIQTGACFSLDCHNRPRSAIALGRLSVIRAFVSKRSTGFRYVEAAAFVAPLLAAVARLCRGAAVSEKSIDSIKFELKLFVVIQCLLADLVSGPAVLTDAATPT